MSLSLAEIDAALKQRAKERETERYEAATAEAKAWLDYQASPQHNTTSLQDPEANPEATPVTQPHYKAPPPGAEDWLRNVFERDNAQQTNHQQPSEPATAQTPQLQHNSPPPGEPTTQDFRNLAGDSEDSLHDIEEAVATNEQHNEPLVNQQQPLEPDTAQTARPQPKAPPPGVPTTLAHHNLIEASEDASAYREEEARDDLSDAQSAATQPSSFQYTPSVEHWLGAEPVTSDAPLPQPSSSAQQLLTTTQPHNGWANMTDNDGRPVLAGNLMTQQVAQRAQPNTGILASRRFQGHITSEKDFLRRWIRALQDFDYGTQHKWQQYCRAKGNGTFDPAIQAPAFTRRFIFLYGGQPEQFFTQHNQLGLLSEQEERRIMQQYSAQYEATHIRFQPPTKSWYWPPRPGDPSLTTPPTVSFDQPYQPTPVPSTTVQHPAATDSATTQHTDPGWQQPGNWEWRASQYTNPGWVVQHWHTTQQWFWGHAEDSWAGYWS